MDVNMKERLLIAKSAEMQLQLATDLLRRATANLAARRHGVAPGLSAAKRALADCEKASVCTTEMIERIPHG